MPRWEVINDGPDRWVLVDNESDDPCPVYETEAVAEKERAERERSRA